MDFTDSKKPVGAAFPQNVIESSGIMAEVEPLLDADTFRRRFFFGIPMISPMTKEKIQSEDLEDFVKRGMARLQFDSKIQIQTKVMRSRLPFDAALYKQFIHLEIPNKPIKRVVRLALASANYDQVVDEKGVLEADKEFPSGGAIYTIPNSWVDPSNATRGLLNVIPISPAYGAISFSTSASQAGATLLSILGVGAFIPSFWTVEYECGLMDPAGQLPVIVNEAIGCAAAMLLAENLIPLYRTASQSLSVDAMSQSINDQMINVLTQKITTLDQRYQGLMKKLKTYYGQNMFTSNI
jgi:hypothetical protein